MIYHRPIETLYRGYRFRSRLEARWAVFFDAIGLEWEYETEGYELSNGERYLPDFYFPKMDWFCEIKPGRAGAQHELQNKTAQLVEDLHTAVLVLGSIPDTTQGALWGFPILYYNPFDAHEHVYTRIITPLGASEGALIYEGQATPQNSEPLGDPRAFEEYMKSAYDAARQARFEFGESG